MTRIISASFTPEKKEWFEKFLRFGFISKGVVYCLLGILTVMAAIGLRGDNGSKEQAFKLIYDQPFGKVILAILTIGLLGYVTLRFFQCFKDSDGKGNDVKGLITRIGYGLSALLYLSLGVYAIKLLIGSSGGSGGKSREFIAAKVLEWPGGEWILGITAVIIIASGVNQIYKGVSKKFMKKIMGVIRSGKEKMFENAGMIGYIARGIVLGIIGYMLLHGAITANPSEAKGTDQAFDFLENTFGSLMMGVVAFGLVAYGVFMFVKAKYQNINVKL